MNSKIAIFIFTLGTIFGTIWVVQPFADNNNALLITDNKPQGGNFSLQSTQGKVQLTDFQGKVVMLYFGYTFCPDVCPTNLSSLAAAYQTLEKSQQDQIQILFISVDPERDTPKRLQDYADYFEAGMIGVTDTPQTLSKVARQYGVVYAKVDSENNANYAVDHSAYTYLIDKQGQLQKQLPHATTPQQFIDALQPFLN